MPVTINGGTGIQTPGVASDTMPTSGGDAVVESGSNSDGEWTRWADGTQHCITAEVSPTTNLAFGGLYRSSGAGNVNANFPVPFILAPTVPVASVLFDEFILPSNPDANKVTATGVTNETGATVAGKLFATGRWK